jgi:hypothetical protein
VPVAQTGAVTYEIARQALHRFVDRQVTLIESTPLPSDLRDIVSAHDLSDDDLQGVWLGAGLATQIGLALIDGPERFVTERLASTRPSPPEATRPPPPSDS